MPLRAMPRHRSPSRSPSSSAISTRVDVALDAGWDEPPPRIHRQVIVRTVPLTSTTISLGPPRTSGRVGSSPASRSRAAVAAATSRSGRRTTVSYPSGGAGGAGRSNGSRRMGTAPSRRASSSGRPGAGAGAVVPAPPPTPAAVTASITLLFDQVTPDAPAPGRDRETIEGSSLTASTAANPAPNRPTDVVSRFAEARRVDSASTPAGLSGAPVLAISNRPPGPAPVFETSGASGAARTSGASDSEAEVRSRRYTRAGTPASRAASTAFCTSSTTRRSR